MLIDINRQIHRQICLAVYSINTYLFGFFTYDI